MATASISNSGQLNSSSSSIVDKQAARDVPSVSQYKEMLDNSKIVNFYKNRSVLITGASGFVGKVLIEKLLRTCPEVKRIYVLIRPKWNKQPKDRLAELLKVPLFDKVREMQTRPLEERVVVVEGDMMKPNLGINEKDIEKIIREVSVVIHSAATVKFDEPLKQSIGINIAGTKNIVELCKKCDKIAALVHVSTAYANCERKEIDEHIYPVEMDPENLLEMANWLDQDTLQELKRRLLGPKPNTYTYTKSIAEWLLIRIARDLPIAICRPSIVVASWREPFPGWIDNFNGPTGIILGAGKGLIRSMYAEKTYLADLIPVDTVINMIVALGWFANVYHSHKRLSDLTECLTESLNESSSSGVVSSVGEGEEPSSLDIFEEHYDISQRMESDRNQQTASNNLYSDTLDANDSNNNDSNEDNQNHEYQLTYDYINEHIDRNSERRADNSSSLKIQQDLHNSLNIQTLHALHMDDGYGSRSPDDNSTASSASECNGTSNKHIVLNRHIAHSQHQLEIYPRSHQYQMSPEAQTRLMEQRESAQLGKKLKKFRRNTQLRLKAKNMPEYLADIPVFHCTSGSSNPITWGQIQLAIMSILTIYPSISTYRYPSGSLTNNARLDAFYRITLHYIPGYIVDMVIRLFGGKPTLVKIFNKFDQAAFVLKAFTSREWIFETNNGLTLFNEFMSDTDKQLFDFDLKELNWTNFLTDYCLGVRQFLLKEPLSNLRQARINLQITYYRNLSLQVLFMVLVGYYFFKS